MPTCVFVHPGAELFGSDRMLVESVRGAVGAGFDVTVALPAQGPLVGELSGTGARVVILPMLVLRKRLLKPSGWPTLLRDAFRGLGAAWRLVGSVAPDCVYVSTITLPQWPLVARLRGIPVLTHVHEAEGSGSRLINGALYVPHLASRIVIVNSRFSLETLARSLPLLAERTRILYNGVAAPLDPTPPRPAIVDALRILYLGRLSPRKGPDVLLDATTLLAERGTDVEVSLLGSAFAGYEWYVAELHRTAEATALSGRVHFLDFDPDIWRIVAAADVIVVPSRLDEPFGNTAVEGLLAFRPVIASDTSGLREAAGGYPTAWLVAPDDPVALADRLQSVVDQWPAIVRGVAESRSRADARHSVVVYREAIASVLRSIAPPRHAAESGQFSAPTV